ncbi:response regulator [Desulfurobacterium sp.]
MDRVTLSRNDSLKLGNTEFHIQTEYYQSSGEVVTLIFKNGEVIKRIQRKPALGENPDEAVKNQHNSVIHRLLSAGKEENRITVDELVLSTDTIDFFRLFVSQICERPDFLFARIIDINGKPILEVIRKSDGVDEEVVKTFLDAFILEEKQFYHMEENGLYLYGFKLNDGNTVVVGFEKEDARELLEKILYQAEDYLKPECGKKKISILIVEDVLFTRLVVKESFKLISREIKDFCFEVVDEAESFSDAIATLKKKKFDVVITDIRLGDGLGTEVAAFIKKHHPETKVIALTMYPEDYEKNKDVFDGFIAKPISPWELKNKLLNILQ